MEEMSKKNEEMDALKQDIEKLRSDLSGLLEVIRDDGKSTLEDVKLNFLRAKRNIEERAQQSFHAAYENLADQTNKVIGNAREEVTKRPLVVVFSALLIGILIGNMSRR